MNNQQFDILSVSREWLQQGHGVTLYTVYKTWGSSPRPPGSLMALRDDGQVAGSVSGGCIEDDLIDRQKQHNGAIATEMVTYGVDAEQARRFGLPCGGSMQLLQESLVDIHHLDVLLGYIGNGKQTTRIVDLRSGELSVQANHIGVHPLQQGQQFIHTLGPRYRLLLIGAGQLSELLAAIALTLDFAVTVCDPRDEYYQGWALDTVDLVRTMPDDTVIAMQPDARMAVVALTHDPKLDDLALMEALSSPAFYVAALGSTFNNDKRRKRLKDFELSTAQISRLYGPAGLDIGSHTPAEIAVSIAAQLVEMRARA